MRGQVTRRVEHHEANPRLRAATASCLSVSAPGAGGLVQRFMDVDDSGIMLARNRSVSTFDIRVCQLTSPYVTDDEDGEEEVMVVVVMGAGGVLLTRMAVCDVQLSSRT